MLDDRRGIAITTTNAAAIAPFDEAATGLLAHRADTAAHLDAALKQDGQLAIAHCLSGFLHLLLGRAELFPPAKHAWEMALASLARRGATAREQMLTDALGAWCADDMELCADRLDETLAAHPLDAMTAKLVQSVRFMLGDAPGMRRSIEHVLSAWTRDQPGYGYMLGCHAFALEETGELDAAERIGCQALEHEPFDVWGCHAVAHVYETRGDAETGITWIAAHAKRWNAVNNFTRHMHWHEALFSLARNEIDAVFDLYDHALRQVKSDDYRDIANAASLLHRLESIGVAVGTRWTELADLAERRARDNALAFAQLHYLLCLAGDRRWDQAFELFAAMDIKARTGRGTQARLLGDIAIPLGKIILAGGNPRSIPALNLPSCSVLARLGGSRAQRQIFERMWQAATASVKPVANRRSMLGKTSPAARQSFALMPTLPGLAVAG